MFTLKARSRFILTENSPSDAFSTNPCKVISRSSVLAGQRDNSTISIYIHIHMQQDCGRWCAILITCVSFYGLTQHITHACPSLNAYVHVHTYVCRYIHTCNVSMNGIYHTQYFLNVHMCTHRYPVGSKPKLKMTFQQDKSEYNCTVRYCYPHHHIMYVLHTIKSHS